MPEMMRAVVLDGPGAPDALKIRDVPRPASKPGWVLIKVRAFGLNRSELHFRRGLGETQEDSSAPRRRGGPCHYRYRKYR